MAVAIGTGTATRDIGAGTYVATPVTSASWTISGSNLAILLAIATSGTVTVTAVSWSLGSGTTVEVVTIASPASNHRVAIWAIPAPTGGAGTYTVTLSGGCTYHITGTYFIGADQTTPSPLADAYSLGSTGQAASQAHNVTNLAAGDASYGGGAVSDSNNGTSSVTPNQTYLADTASGVDAEAGYATGTTQVTTVFFGTNDPMARAGVRIVAAAAATQALEWQAPKVQLTNHFVTSIVNMRALPPLVVPALSTQGASVTQPAVTDVQLQPYTRVASYLRTLTPMPVPYLVTTPTRVTNPLDWVSLTPDVIWTDG